MNFAHFEEETMQTKVQYAMAERQLRRERQMKGRVSDGIIQRVKAVGKAVAELYEAHEATQVAGPGRCIPQASRQLESPTASNTTYYGCTYRKSVVI
jgi:hypothetical protein